MNLATLHDVMAGYVERGEIPGLVTVISWRDEAWFRAIGTPRDTIFRISSMTKPIVAVATMILVESGVLGLDEPVDRLLPELANRRVLRQPGAPLDDTVPARRAITVRDLLAFTWGFGTPFVADADTWPIVGAARAAGIRFGPPEPRAQAAPDEWMRSLGSLPLIVQPGDQWLYDTGADVLAVLVARAAGQSFDVFLRERIFAPLGMSDTGFSVPPADIDRLAPSYLGDLSLYDPGKGGQWSRPPAFPSGAGGLVSTADDYLAFSDMMRRGGAPILSPASVALMTTDHLGHGWGLGVGVDAATGRYGWDGGLGTVWRVDPKRDAGVILLTQRAWESSEPPRVSVDFLAAAYEALTTA